MPFDQPLGERERQMLPKTLHHVWVGSAMPEKQRACIATWKAHNPDWELVCWNETNIDFSAPLVSEAYRHRKWAKVADIVRLMAVHRHGGVYLDTDIEVRRPLDPVLKHRCFFAFQNERQVSDLVANSVFGAGPGHWFVALALQRLLGMRTVPCGLDRPTRYGPKLITRLLREHGLQGHVSGGCYVKDICILPTPVFFPFSWDEAFEESCIQDCTLAVHFWERSWEDGASPVLRHIRRLRKVFNGEGFNRTTKRTPETAASVQPHIARRGSR